MRQHAENIIAFIRNNPLSNSWQWALFLQAFALLLISLFAFTNVELNGDSLYIHFFQQDLLSGRFDIGNWFLMPAQAIFPDQLLFYLFSFWSTKVTHILFGVMLSKVILLPLAGLLLLRALGVRCNLIMYTAILNLLVVNLYFYSTSIFPEDVNHSVSLFRIENNHFCLVLAPLITLLMYLKSRSVIIGSCVAFLLSLLGQLSSAIFIFAFTVPFGILLLYNLYTTYKSTGLTLALTKDISYGLAVGSGTLLGIILFRFGIPLDPVQNRFYCYGDVGFSVKNFLHGLRKLLKHTIPYSGIWGLFTPTFLIMAYLVYRHRKSDTPNLNWILLLALLSFFIPFFIGAGLGVFVTNNLARYFPLPFTLLVIATFMVIHKNYFRQTVVLAATILPLLLLNIYPKSISFLWNLGHGTVETVFTQANEKVSPLYNESLFQCVDELREHTNLGSGITRSYWTSRTLAYRLGNHTNVNEADELFYPVTFMQKLPPLSQAEDTSPLYNFALLASDDPWPANAPQGGKTYACQDPSFRIVYFDGTQLDDYIRSKAHVLRSIYTRGNKLGKRILTLWNRNQVWGGIKRRDNPFAIETVPSNQGSFTYGPRLRLIQKRKQVFQLPPGDYTFLVSYSAKETQPTVPYIEVGCFTDEQNTVFAHHELTYGLIQLTEFSVTIPTSPACTAPYQVRTWHPSGSKITLESISIFK